jgi:hypothetical protein
MQTDKDLAMRVVDRLEEYYLRYIVLEQMMTRKLGTSWKREFQQMMGAREFQGPLRAQFETIRQRILDAPDLTSAVREVLKYAPGTDPMGSAGL